MTELEWLAENIDNLIPYVNDASAKKFNELVEQAKEMEEQQSERMYAEADNIMRFLDTEVELKLSDTKTIERIKWYFETYFEQFKNK
jgi:hypothetical protein